MAGMSHRRQRVFSLCEIIESSPRLSLVVTILKKGVFAQV